MKRFVLLLISFFLFVQEARCEENQKMFIFTYKILTEAEVSRLYFENAIPNFCKESKAGKDCFYLFGAVKLSSSAKVPKAMIEIEFFDRQRKSFNCTYKPGWIGCSGYTFFLIKLWDSRIKPEIKYNFKILMLK